VVVISPGVVVIKIPYGALFLAAFDAAVLKAGVADKYTMPT